MIPNFLIPIFGLFQNIYSVTKLFGHIGRGHFGGHRQTETLFSMIER
jgi:hypothetical protein